MSIDCTQNINTSSSLLLENTVRYSLPHTQSAAADVRVLPPSHHAHTNHDPVNERACVCDNNMSCPPRNDDACRSISTRVSGERGDRHLRREHERATVDRGCRTKHMYGLKEIVLTPHRRRFRSEGAGREPGRLRRDII